MLLAIVALTLLPGSTALPTGDHTSSTLMHLQGERGADSGMYLQGERGAETGRRLDDWHETGGADHHWWNIGGLLLGWSALRETLNSNFVDQWIDRVGEWMVSVGNVVFVLMVAVGYLLLPRRLMVYVGFFGLFVGPAAVQAVFTALGWTVAVAAYVPAVVVGCMWLLAFLGSNLAQRIGLWLGMDADHDGDVDWHDVIHELMRRLAPEAHAEAERLKTKHPQMRDVYEKVEKLERAVAALHDLLQAGVKNGQTALEDLHSTLEPRRARSPRQGRAKSPTKEPWLL